MEERLIRAVCEKFQIGGRFRTFEMLTAGHINTTCRAVFDQNGEDKSYILQRINTFVFKNPLEIMENVSDVTEYIRSKIKAEGQNAERKVLHFEKSADGKFCLDDETGFWRCYRFIDDSVTYDVTDALNIIEEAGKAFGEFQMYLADYPVEKLHIAIPHFHNTVNRYENFERAVAQNKSGRATEVAGEIAAYRELEEIATAMYKMQRAGKLPLKVTHNDTKTNNVLFDKKTGEHLAVLDLDTVMPGLVGFDFGDAIRYIGNTCAEDEKDIRKVMLDMKKFEAFTGGFLQQVGKTLTETEKETLALGAITMTTECGLRFLTDYINGDEYFKVDYPTHNLDRSRCQLALAKDMIRRKSDMDAIVKHGC